MIGWTNCAFSENEPQLSESLYSWRTSRSRSTCRLFPHKGCFVFGFPMEIYYRTPTISLPTMVVLEQLISQKRKSFSPFLIHITSHRSISTTYSWLRCCQFRNSLALCKSSFIYILHCCRFRKDQPTCWQVSPSISLPFPGSSTALKRWMESIKRWSENVPLIFSP